MPNHPAFLKTHQDQIQNQSGQVVRLRGVGLGGWMNMENFVTGFPANESGFPPGGVPRPGGRKSSVLL